MAFTVTATVTRSDLGLSELNINDHLNYSLSPNIMSGTVSWDRREAASPWVDGSITTSRRRNKVNENIQVNVYGDSQTELLENMQNLVEAFSQNKFYMTIKLNGVTYQYECEAADYAVEWGYKMHSRHSTVTFQIPRHPVPTSGGV